MGDCDVIIYIFSHQLALFATLWLAYEAKNKEIKAVLGVIIQAIFPIENFNDTQ